MQRKVLGKAQVGFLNWHENFFFNPSFYFLFHFSWRNSRINDFDPANYEIDNFESGEIEVTYSGENEAKKELVWI